MSICFAKQSSDFNRGLGCPQPAFQNIQKDILKHCWRHQKLLEVPSYLIMKMFNLIRVGERAGSGVPDIFSTWESEGWIEPIIEEQYKQDRTILKLSFIVKEVLPDFLPESKKSGRKKIKTNEIEKRKEAVLQLIKENSYITVSELVEKLELSRGMVESALKNLKLKGKLVREGSTKAGKWIVKDKSK